MECEVCGASIDINSRYCQKCGNEINKFGVPQKQLLNLLEEKMRIVKEGGTKQLYQNMINRLNQNCFREVELHKSSLEGIDFSDIIKEKNGKLSLEDLGAAEAAKLIMSYFINEFDAIHNEIGSIMDSLHGDRVACVRTAYQHYQRALQAENLESKKSDLIFAANKCLEGMDMLREELKDHLGFFEELPRSTFRKLFCGIKLQDAEKRLQLIQKTFRFYCLGSMLLMEIDLKNEEIKKLVQTAHNERFFLNEMQKSKGYSRLLEVDDENEQEWSDMLKELTVNMFFIEKYIEADDVTIKILEEK